MHNLQAAGQHKNKSGFSHSPVYDPFASTLMVNSYVSKMCIQNIANIFAGFWIRSCWILREIRENYCAANISTFTVLKSTLGAFTLLTSRFLKSRHFDPTIYTCAKNREVSVSRNFAIFWLVVHMCDHRLQCMHSCMQSMQYAWGPRISIHVSKSARS